MLNKFTIETGNKIIKIHRELIQGSDISPVLFNIFINDLLLKYENKKIEMRSYVDDAACIWDSIEQAKKTINI